MNAFHVSLKLTVTEKGFLTFVFRKRGKVSRKKHVCFEVCWWVEQQRFVNNAGYRSMLEFAPDALDYLKGIIPVLEKEELYFSHCPLKQSAIPSEKDCA